MEIIHINPEHEEKMNRQNPSCVAFGTFDGVHLGHQKVLGKAIDTAKAKGLQAGVMTFHPHPKEVLGKVSKITYLTPLPDKLQLLEQLGIDFVIVLQFTPSFALLSPDDFIQQYILNLNIKHVVTGFDFCFGHKGEGNTEYLLAWSRLHGAFEIDVVSSVDKHNEKISSSRIRAAIKRGDMAQLPAFLGRRYRVRGKVVQGDKRGRTIGFPTANIHPVDSFVLPPFGVYSVYLEWKKRLYPGALNIGVKPTFKEGEEPSIEVHVLDEQLDLYDQLVAVEWVSFIRPEKRFSNAEELVRQIKADVQVARNQLSHINHSSSS